MSWILLYGVSGGRIIDMTDCVYGNGETVKMDKFDQVVMFCGTVTKKRHNKQ